MLLNSQILSENFSEEVILRSISLIKEFRCTPEEIIFLENQVDDNSIFFVEGGTIELYIDTFQ